MKLGQGALFDNRYRVEEKLGEGGMGAVYKAWDIRLERRVAVKVMPLGDRPDRVERFRQEARAIARLNHPNIVTIYDTAESENQSYIVMEYLVGMDLDQVELENVAAVLDVITPICDALDYSHRQGVVHRDIKPGNIVLVKDGHVKLVDFGLAVMEGSPKLTARGLIPGTFLYLSPEQINGERPNALTDQYSLGVVLFELLTGRFPFDTRDNLEQAFEERMRVDPPPIRTYRPDLAANLQAAIDKSLQRDPARRFNSMAQMHGVLKLARAKISENLPAAPKAREKSEGPIDQLAKTQSSLHMGFKFKSERGDDEQGMANTSDTGVPLTEGRRATWINSVLGPEQRRANRRTWLVLLVLALLAAAVGASVGMLLDSPLNFASTLSRVEEGVRQPKSPPVQPRPSPVKPIRPRSDKPPPPG